MEGRGPGKRFITVKTAKTGQTVDNPIFPLLFDELAKLDTSPRPSPQSGEGASAALVLVNGNGNGAVAHRGDIHADSKGGLRRATVRDFHSFRVTWVTLALTARVPLELVQKVTGHKTTDIVLKHYFQPGREDFRRALQSAMPTGTSRWSTNIHTFTMSTINTRTPE